MIGSLHSATRLAPGARSSRRDFQRVSRAGRVRTRRCTVRSALDVEVKGDVVSVRPPKPKYATVLSIDGGGVRGLVPAAVLQAVEEEIINYIKENDLVPESAKGKKIEIDMADYFDVISGTSVGSIVALYLASKGGDCAKLFEKYGWDVRAGSVEGVVKLISKRAKDVFPDSWYSWIPLVGPLLDLIKMIFFPKFSDKGMEEVLKDAFGKKTLKDVHTGLIVPTFELSEKQAFSFWSTGADPPITGYAACNPRAAEAERQRRSSAVPGSSTRSDGPPGVPSIAPLVIQEDPDTNEATWDPDVIFAIGPDHELWQVAKASSSAPTFFPATTFGPVGGGEEKTFIDGGVIANNPTLQSIAFIEQQLKCPMEKLAVLSLGTGHAQPDTSNLNNAGALDWVIKDQSLISILMDGSSEYLQALVDFTYYQLRKLPPGQYVRISVCVEQGHKYEQVLSEMDNPDNVEPLVEIGGKLGLTYRIAIKEFVEEFLFAAQDPSPKDA